MIVKYQILCSICNTLANPLCECGAVGVTHSISNILAVYTNNLGACTLMKVWEDNDGIVHKVRKLRDITEAKVSKI